jgi:hypothetical protein
MASTTPKSVATVSVSEFDRPKRLRVSLDPGIVLERAILRRLSGHKRKRAQDWLRSLLVQGFLAEGRWLRANEFDGERGHEHRARSVPATPFASWLERSHAKASRKHIRRLRADQGPIEPVKLCDGPKPFAHLRGVIG